MAKASTSTLGRRRPSSSFNSVETKLNVCKMASVTNTRGSAIAERPTQRSVSVEMLSYCCT